ncbi:MAG: alanine racemase [Calditrichia bacterium]
MKHQPHLTWIEISEQAYTRNLNFFKNRLQPTVELSLVVKANAYGHGLPQILQIALKNNIRSFSVHSINEAEAIRNISDEADVLIMGPVYENDLPSVLNNNFRLAVFDKKTLQIIDQLSRKYNKKARLHIKLNTGTNRLGIKINEINEYLEVISRNNLLEADGIYTHFANIEDTTDHQYAYQQLNQFNSTLSLIKEKIALPKVHTACSAAILLFPETHFTMVRLGISQYGYWPSRETFVSFKSKESADIKGLLSPILSWYARIAQIHQLDAGECIGYGCTYQVTRPSRIATLPVGYSDGIDRRLSNNGYVLLHGKRAPIRGRICMNLMMIDVTDIPEAQEGDRVTLLGKDGKESITADEWASWIHSINYEVVSRINPQIPRFIVQ